LYISTKVQLDSFDLHKAAYQALAQVDKSTLASIGRFCTLESSTRCKRANSHWNWLERIA
jgi:hypothetical protein